MIYENPHYRKVAGSFTLLVRCAHCKTDIAVYQKVGKGGVLRLYVDRIVRSAIDLSRPPKALLCPRCGRQLGTRMLIKKRGKEAYVMARGHVNTRPL